MKGMMVMSKSLLVIDTPKSCSECPLGFLDASNTLNYIERYTHAYVMGHQRTAPITLKDTQEVYYILSGTATITGGGKTYNLYPGACALVPAGLEFVVDNANEDILEMYLVSEYVTDGFTPNKEIIVRDEKTVAPHFCRGRPTTTLSVSPLTVCFRTTTVESWRSKTT